MSFIDWCIVIIPTVFVVSMGIYSMKYVRCVADFLSAGRVAGRYVMSIGDVANALAIVTLAAYIEVHYKTGFALTFWNNLMMPLGIVMSLFGYCTYRFRETKAMSLGQFLEMRYNRPLRIFASGLRSISEMLANMIMPAIAARFFIYYLDLPHAISFWGYEVSTFLIIVFICLTIAISIICFGGTLALLITDSIQGMILFPLMVVFVVFVLTKFNWSSEIVPVMMDRVKGESFLNPYDLANLRDFNLFMVILTLVGAIVHRASWTGAGYSTAAKTPHEQKMAALLGAFRGALNTMFYILIALCIIVVMNYKKYAPNAKEIRSSLTKHISEELVEKDKRADFISKVTTEAEQYHVIDKGHPLSQDVNLDTPILNKAHTVLKEYNGDTEGNAKFQQFRTLYMQLLSASGMRNLLPPVMIGLFALLLVLAMISTDDTRIYSASLTFTQDVVIPLCPKDIKPKTHMWLLRIVSICVGIFFLIGSTAMSQLDFINLFVTSMTVMWMGGCGPVMIFGLYSKFGNAAGAFASLISSIFIAGVYIFLQRNWADIIYPYLVKMNWVAGLDGFLQTVSSPFNPFIVWKMDPVKYPINAYEAYAMTMVVTLVIFCAVSYFTQKEPFNLDRMLHRGIYNLEGENKTREPWTWSTLLSKLVGITPEYSLGDKCIAWSVFFYNFVFQFVIAFVGVIIWNMVTPWPIEWWGHYFFIINLVIPGCIAFIATFWFGIGGFVDLCRLFRDLEARENIDVLDNGLVDGNVSLADKAKFAELEKKEKENSK